MRSQALIVIHCFAMLFAWMGEAVALELPLPPQPHIVVHGVGEVEQIPDIVRVKVAVTVTAEDLSAAKQQVDRTIGKAMLAGKEQGVLMDDISASKINASPQYAWENQQRVYKGEQVSREVEIKLRDAKKYNALIDGLLASGITRVLDIQFEFSNRDELEAEALTLALEDASRRAKTIGKRFRVKFLKAFQIAPLSEGPAPMVRAMEMSAKSPADDHTAPLKLAKQTLRQRVRVVYLLNE